MMGDSFKQKSQSRFKTMGKFDWGVWYVFFFLYVQFWIRLATVSYRGKKFRTTAFPVVRSVNKWRDTRNCVQNEPEYAILVTFTNHFYWKALRLIFCYLIWKMRHNYNCFDNGHRDVTGHCKMSVLGTAGNMVTTHENSVIMWLLKGPKLFSILQNPLEIRKDDGLHIAVLSISLIEFRIWVEFLIGQFILEITFSIRLAALQWVPTAHFAGRRSWKSFTHRV